MELSKALLLAATAFISACSPGLTRMHSDDALRYADYVGPPVEEFTAFRFDGWEAVGRNKLVIWTGINQAYLVTVWDSCPDLMFAQRVGITSNGHMVSRLDSVLVGREKCPIKEVRPIDIKQMKLDRAALKGK